MVILVWSNICFTHIHYACLSPLFADNIAHWDLATKYIQRELREADESNLLDEEGKFRCSFYSELLIHACIFTMRITAPFSKKQFCYCILTNKINIVKSLKTMNKLQIYIIQLTVALRDESLNQNFSPFYITSNFCPRLLVALRSDF